FLLAIPMVLEMGMESVFVLVDIFFVSQLGSEAVAAVGLTEAVLTLLYAIAMGLSMGATALIARRVGERNLDAARATAVQIIWVGVAVSLIVGISGVVFAEDILRLMGAEPAIVAGGSTYTATMLGGSATIFFLFLLNAIFRGAGNAVIAMRALWIANGINIVLDPCFIFGLGPFPELGVSGAAVATNIGRGIGVGYQIYCLAGGATQIKLGLADFGLRAAILLRFLRISLPAAFQFTVAMSSYLLLMRIVARYGSDAVAGLTIGVRIFAFTFLPAWGLGNAAATLVGQNLGAGQPDRAERSVWMAARWNTGLLLGVAALFIAIPGVLAGPFTDDPVVLGYVVDCLRIVSLSYGFFAIGMIVTQAFNGAGDTDTPTWINIVCYWLLQIPLAYWLAEQIGWGPHGVFAAIAISDAFVAVIAVAVFRRGRWKERVV
ncbi:MAG: MATE family efflux transporter, partial [Gammaproteobacteria bacterium]|nr:MATE family efflux transporter [Gammaproteobacteria bacterium]